jgi:WD40 repeat protein
MWDAETGVTVGKYREECIGRVYSVASGTLPPVLMIWKTGAVVGKPLEGILPVLPITSSHDGWYITSRSCGKTIRIWDASGGAVVGNL